MLVDVAIPIECIGKVECDFYGHYHVEVMGQKVDTDEDTYLRLFKAMRDSPGIEVDE